MLTPSEQRLMYRKQLRPLVRGVYDLQKLRIQTGNRVVGNFKVKAGQAPGEKEENLDPEVKELLATIRAHNKLVADAIAAGELTLETADKKKPLKAKVAGQIFKVTKKEFVKITKDGFPPKSEFEGNPVISEYTELCLLGLYVDLCKEEDAHFDRIRDVISDHPIWPFFEGIKGIDRAMAGVCISELDPYKAETVSSFWRYCGVDVVKVGDNWEGRCKKEGHLVDKEYIDKDGKKQTRKSITYNPFLKTKMCGVLAGCFIKCNSPQYRPYYDNYKHRMENHAKWGVQNDGKIKGNLGHRDDMAKRYMIKMFLADLWAAWRTVEGLPVRATYAVDKLGHRTHQKPIFIYDPNRKPKAENKPTITEQPKKKPRKKKKGGEQQSSDAAD